MTAAAAPALAVNERSPEAAKLFDGGAMGATMRAVDWSRTPLGPPERWTPALRTMVGLLLRNHSPMLLWWGPKFVQLYNDAYRPVLGSKHPKSMGQPVAECWEEIIEIIGPMIEAPFRGGPATVSDDLDLLLKRNDFTEETHFAVAYSPVPDDTVEQTGIGGVLATVAETTEQVYAHRQLKTLRDLGARATEASTAERACELASQTLAQNGRDVPFALFYLLDDSGLKAQRICQTGFDPGARVPFPERFDLADAGEGEAGAIVRVLKGGAAEVFAGPPGLPRGGWSVSPRQVIAVPLASADKRTPYGALVCGLSPHRRPDERYRGLFELASAQVVTAIRTARAYQENEGRLQALAQAAQQTAESERRLREQAEQTTRFSEAFVGVLGHDLRNPLGAISSTAELIRLRSSDERIRGPVGRISTSAVRMERMIGQLLDFTSIRLGQGLPLERSEADLFEICRLAIDEISGQYKKDLVLESSGDGRGQWDKDRLAQLLSNLFANACQHGAEGSPVQVRLDGSKPTAVKLEVRNQGAIPVELLPGIFEPMRHAQTSRARRAGSSGLGLGLYISQQIVLAHRGQIRAESAAGATAFVIELPRAAG